MLLEVFEFSFSPLFFPSFMAKLPSVMYFVMIIVTEFTTALPCVPRDRKPIDIRGARAAFWDGTVVVQDKLYTSQSDPRNNTGTIYVPSVPLTSRDARSNELGRFDEISSN